MAQEDISRKKKNIEKRPMNVMRYIGLGTEFAVGIALTLFLGMKIDEKYPQKIPLFVWILPLLFIFAVIFNLIKEVLHKKDGK